MIRDAIRSGCRRCRREGMTLAYVDDVADGHLAAFDRGKPGERYILADGYATNREICEAAVEAAGQGPGAARHSRPAWPAGSRSAARRSRA